MFSLLSVVWSSWSKWRSIQNYDIMDRWRLTNRSSNHQKYFLKQNDKIPASTTKTHQNKNNHTNRYRSHSPTLNFSKFMNKNAANTIFKADLYFCYTFSSTKATMNVGHSHRLDLDMHLPPNVTTHHVDVDYCGLNVIGLWFALFCFWHFSPPLLLCHLQVG